jgi:hypothetical protein
MSAMLTGVIFKYSELAVRSPAPRFAVQQTCQLDNLVPENDSQLTGPIESYHHL